MQIFPRPAAKTSLNTEVEYSTTMWLAFVILIGLNLRPFLTASGTMANIIATELAMPLGRMAWLTLIPMMIMGMGAFCIPALRARLSTRHITLGALLVLCIGCALRAVVQDSTSLIATAVLCGAGVALLQAVLPGIIKARFPNHMAPVTGLYSATLMGGGALGAQLTPLLSQASDSWRAGLAVWALPICLAAWIAWRVLPRQEVRAAQNGPSLGMLKRPRTWTLIASFGFINAGYATLITWLAVYYQGHGWSPTASGGLVALLSVAQASAALLIPTLAAKSQDRRPWIWLVLLFQVAGFSAISYVPDTAPYVWAVLLGIGLGGCFAMIMVVALDHFPDSQRAGTLSALMQGGGFPIAALAPLLASWIYEATGGFHAVWSLHLALVAFICVLSVRFQPKHYARVMQYEN